MNEGEGGQITGLENPEDIIAKVVEMYPNAKIVLTLGKDGAIYAEGDVRYQQPIFKVQAVDTTAAGDTFTGFFFANILKGKSARYAMKQAADAAAISVTKNGAAESIPHRVKLY